MDNSEKVREGSNNNVKLMLPQYHEIKETSVAFTINKMVQVFFGKLDGFKCIDVVGTSIRCGSADDMVLNPTIDIFSGITCDSCNVQGEKQILLYLNVCKRGFYALSSLQGARDLMTIIYPTNI